MKPRERLLFAFWLLLFSTIVMIASVRSARADETGHTIYKNDFEMAEAGKVPDELMVLSGEFEVKADGTNRFLELPGTPLDSYAVLFGPVEKENDSVRARIFATAKGRRTPTFGVGLGGVSGFNLQVSPAKEALEILKDQASQTNVTFKWKSGTWTGFGSKFAKSRTGNGRLKARLGLGTRRNPGNG